MILGTKEMMEEQRLNSFSWSRIKEKLAEDDDHDETDYVSNINVQWAKKNALKRKHE